VNIAGLPELSKKHEAPEAFSKIYGPGNIRRFNVFKEPLELFCPAFPVFLRYSLLLLTGRNEYRYIV
jgi:hypothetical protein